MTIGLLVQTTFIFRDQRGIERGTTWHTCTFLIFSYRENVTAMPIPQTGISYFTFTWSAAWPHWHDFIVEGCKNCAKKLMVCVCEYSLHSNELKGYHLILCYVMLYFKYFILRGLFHYPRKAPHRQSIFVIIIISIAVFKRLPRLY